MSASPRRAQQHGRVAAGERDNKPLPSDSKSFRALGSLAGRVGAQEGGQLGTHASAALKGGGAQAGSGI